VGAAENLALHERWTDAENSHDLSHHDEFLHPDIELQVAGAEPISGLDGYLVMMEANYSGLENFHSAVEDRFATDDRVVCRWRTTGVHNGEMFGVPPTGKRVEFTGVSVWEFDGGKARRGFVFPDVAAIIGQLS
jgi:steroid delta-isomerase-like uncharacterized protein